MSDDVKREKLVKNFAVSICCGARAFVDRSGYGSSSVGRTALLAYSIITASCICYTTTHMPLFKRTAKIATNFTRKSRRIASRRRIGTDRSFDVGCCDQISLYPGYGKDGEKKREY